MIKLTAARRCDESVNRYMPHDFWFNVFDSGKADFAHSYTFKVICHYK